MHESVKETATNERSENKLLKSKEIVLDSVIKSSKLRKRTRMKATDGEEEYR